MLFSVCCRKQLLIVLPSGETRNDCLPLLAWQQLCDKKFICYNSQQ